MSDLVDNERHKLTANWLNASASGVILSGVVAPIIAVTFGLAANSGVPIGSLAFLSVIWLLIGFSLHLAARRVLGGLK